MGKFVRPKNKKYAITKISNVDYFEKNDARPDYKDVLILRRFITQRGKILGSNITSLGAQNQRLLSEAIKKARFMALLPYTDRHAI